MVDGLAIGRGVGASKKRAEQEAAAEALRELSSADRPKRRRVRLRGRRRNGPRSGTVAPLARGDERGEGADEAAAADHSPGPALVETDDRTADAALADEPAPGAGGGAAWGAGDDDGHRGLEPERPSSDGGV